MRSRRAGFTLGIALAAGACAGCGPQNNGAERTAAEAPDTLFRAAPSPDTAAGATAEDSIPAQEDSRWTAGDTRVEPRAAGSTVLHAVRTARHEDFDRIVYEFAKGIPGYRISYIDRPVRQCGSGDVVPFEGDAWLSMVFEPADAHTEEGRPTVAERTRRPALPNVIELKLICDFEAQVEWVAGVHAPMEYRVLTLVDPDRIVVDVRHPSPR